MRHTSNHLSTVLREIMSTTAFIRHTYTLNRRIQFCHRRNIITHRSTSFPRNVTSRNRDFWNNRSGHLRMCSRWFARDIVQSVPPRMFSGRKPSKDWLQMILAGGNWPYRVMNEDMRTTIVTTAMLPICGRPTPFHPSFPKLA